MNIILARSPYIIIVNEPNQTSSKVELYIWNKGLIEPTIPTYVMSESIASITQTQTSYNISNFISEYINPIEIPNLSSISEAERESWCFCKVKRYATVSGTESLLDTTTYTCVDGFSKVDDGFNYNIGNATDFVLLNNNNIIVNWNTIPTYNFICTRNGTNYVASYYNAAGTLISTETILTSGSAEVFNFIIPLVSYPTESVKLIISNTNSIVINTEYICEPKYTPVNCNFINQFGGWQQLTFFKAQTNTIETKSSEYNLMQENVNYNPILGQKNSFNINGTQSIKLNTGFVYENYAETITQLLLSKRILINNKPVTVKTKSQTLKTYIKDKNINYEIEFEYSNNILNDVI